MSVWECFIDTHTQTHNHTHALQCFVYCPIAHWVWGPGGWLAQVGTLTGGTGGALDFAGGFVVEINSGVSALAASLVLGKRHKEDRDAGPVKITLNLLGATLLWVGWFGFNGVSVCVRALAMFWRE